jgi:hydrogenase nickel incorporation protein HypA/HybF
MHEMSLAQNILDIALKTASANQVNRVVRITIRAGQLRGIVPEQLKFCFGFVAKDSIAEGADLLVNSLPIRAACKQCKDSFFVKEYSFVCPACGSEQVDVVQGMELLVENIEVE